MLEGPAMGTGGMMARISYVDPDSVTDPELATSRMVAGLLDLEADFIAALRQKKKPEVTAAARESARAHAFPHARPALFERYCL